MPLAGSPPGTLAPLPPSSTQSRAQHLWRHNTRLPAQLTTTTTPGTPQHPAGFNVTLVAQQRRPAGFTATLVSPQHPAGFNVTLVAPQQRPAGLTATLVAPQRPAGFNVTLVVPQRLPVGGGVVCWLLVLVVVLVCLCVVCGCKCCVCMLHRNTGGATTSSRLQLPLLVPVVLHSLLLLLRLRS